MNFIRMPLLIGLLIGGLSLTAESRAAEKDQLQAPTHRQVRLIEPKVNGKTLKLHTIATTADGHLLAAVGGQSMQYLMNAGGYETKVIQEPALVLMLDSEGKILTKWKLDLTPSALAVSPDGSIYVGGSGKIAKLGPDGSLLKTIDSPHVGDINHLREKTAESLRKSQSRMSEVYESQMKTLRERVETIEEKDEGERSRLETAQLNAFQTQLEMFEKLAGKQGEEEQQEVEDTQLDAAVLRSMSITSLAASDEDVFVCATDPRSRGYSIWRTSADLESGSDETIMEGLRGCCGQMDIQCCDQGLLVSENTKFSVGIYDRNGRAQGKFGSRDRTSRAGFGSCCNPMNSLSMSDGTVLTAESSIGHIKRFDANGKLVAYIGKASIGGGCKHCALGYDAKNDLYYMMYEDKNAICVLASNENTPVTLAEKKQEQRQTDFLARAAGEWALEKKEEKSRLSTWFGGGRGGSSQHPISALNLSPNGAAKIVEGMYKVYGDKAALELTEAESDSPDSFGFALAIDQARFLEGTWKFDQDDTATLTFQGLSSVTLKRTSATEDCETACAGKECGDPNCKDKSCPLNANKMVQVAVKETEFELAGPANEAEFAEISQVSNEQEVTEYLEQMQEELDVKKVTPVSSSQSRFEYKMVSKKQVREEGEDYLNQLGSQGWEFCDYVGKKLLFKRSSVVAGASK
ncbi:MAG: hypothetical protein AB8B91_12625 [Rubripirellula sp.]